jgi:O-antigen/teichoic acid export membrane protein
MTSLKQKAISDTSRGLEGRILQPGTTFIIGIIFVRLFTPEQYGLVAMATVFIFVSYIW